VDPDNFSELFKRVTFLSSVFFCLPFIIDRRAPPILSQATINSSDFARNGFIAALVLVVGLSVVHYSIAGVPLLSGNVDEARFRAIESGMFGIPSRFAVYGPSILAFILIILLNGRSIGVGLFAASGLAILILLFLQGSKSSVAQFLLIAAVAYNYLDRDIRGKINSVGVVFLIFSVIAFFFVLERLNSIHDKDLVKYLASRLTDQSMAPVTALIDEPFQLYLRSPFMMVNDILYPFARLFGVPIELSNEQLSRYLYGLRPGDFSVPVTPGFIAYSFRDFGEPLVYFVMLTYGLICRHVYFSMSKVRGISLAWFIFCVQYMLYVGLTSGNLFYLIPNYLFVFLVLYFINRIWMGSSNREER